MILLQVISRGRGGYNNNSYKIKKGSTTSTSNESSCYRCGMKNHWQSICRTPKYFVKLYQDSLNNKGNGIEANFAFQNDAQYEPMDLAYQGNEPFLVL